MGKIVFILFFLQQTAEAMMRFMPEEQLVATAEYIVMAKIQTVSTTRKTLQYRRAVAKVVRNKLQVIESIKGSLLPEKFFTLDTLKFDGWMEDNVELPSKGSNVLLFLKRDEKGEYRPVNGIQGVWKIDSDGNPRYGTLKEIKKIAEKQAAQVEESCRSKVFTSLLDTAETQTQRRQYSKALELYRKAYEICPMRDLEEQMAWLLGEVGKEDEFVGELTADIDHDNRLEVAKWSKFASDAYTDYYQLILVDDDGEIIWRGPTDMNRSNPLVFVASDFGISTPEILADIDLDGYTELLAQEIQSDVSPTFYRRLRWKGNGFKILPSKALMCSEADPKHFKWADNESGKGAWISEMSQNKPHSNGLVKVSIIRNNSKTCSRMGTALVRFVKDGATVVKWIKTIFCEGS